jgi:gliding motility-associated-like protein
MCRSFFFLFVFVLISSITKAQLATPEVIVEPVETHNGEVGGVDLTGFTTYRVYLNLESDDFIVSALFANPVTATQPEPIDIIFSSECEIYQDPAGEYLGSEITCPLIPSFPALEFDSWLTIGMECSNDPGSVSATYFDLGAEAQLEMDFNEGNGIGFGTIEVNNGAIFALNDQPNGVPVQDADGNWKVLIAQITTCGNFELCFGAQIQEVLDGPNITHTFELCATSPCDDNPLDVSSSSTNLSCFEDGTGTISTEVTLDGNGDLDFDLILSEDGEDTILSEDDLIGDFTDLDAGDYIVVTTDAVGCMNFSDTLTITQPDDLVLDVTEDNGVLCAGEETGALSASATGGTGEYEFDFDDGNGYGTATSVTGLACGEYNVSVQDDNGCEASVLEEIVCPEPIAIDMAINEISCFEACDGSIEGTVTGGTGELSYAWTGCDGFTSADLEISDLCPCDSYQLMVTDENGCQDSISFEITEPLELTTTATVENVNCFGDASGQLIVIAEGGTGAIEIVCEDSNGVEVDNTSAVPSGTYICTTTDVNMCTVVDTLEVTQPDELVFTLDTTSISCFDYSDGIISVDATGGVPGSGDYQYSLEPDPNGPSMGPVFDSLPADVYTVSVSDSLGCITTEEIEIFEPDGIQLNIETTSVSCNGGSDGDLLIEASGGTDPITYEIESNDDMFSQDGDGFFEDLQATGYGITVTDDNGCAVTDSVVVNQPDTLMATVLANVDVTCGGDCDGAVLLDVTGGTPEYEIIWNGDPQLMNDELCAGPNQVNITDAQGCTFAAEVIVNEPTPMQFLINTQNATCTGMTDGSATVDVIGGTGEVTVDVGGVDLDNLAEGEYIITAVDSVGCFAQDTIFMESNIESDLALQLFSSPVTCWNQADGTATAAVSGGEEPITYQWDDPDSLTTATAVGLPEELYSVTVTDAQGCELSGSIEVEPTEGCFFVATAITPNSDGINDEWVIGGLEYFPNSLVQVYNRWGQLVFESRGYPTRWDGRFNGNRLPIADYYYVITFEESGLETMTGTVTIKY